MFNISRLKISPQLKILALMYGSYLWTPQRNHLNELQVIRASANWQHHDECRKQQHNHKEPQVSIPELNFGARFYIYFSTTLHIVNVFLVITVKSKGYKAGENLLVCHMPKFALTEVISQDSMLWLSLVLSALHIFWRSVMYIYASRFKLYTIYYLLAYEENLDERIEVSNKDEHIIELNHIQKDPSGQLMGTTFYQRLVYFEFDDSTKSVHELRRRPNRNWISREQMLDYVNLQFDRSAWLILFCGISLIPFGLYTLFLRHEYLFEACEGAYFQPLAWTYWLRVGTSAILSLVHFYDNFVALLFPPNIVSILTVDLMIYWQNIRLDLDRLVVLMPNLRFLHDSIEAQMETGRNYRGLYPDNQSNFKQIIEDIRLVTVTGRNIQEDVHLVQTKLGDFFHLMKDLDGYVSKIITFAFCVWLSINAVITLAGLQQANILLVRLIQIFCLLTWAITSFSLISLKRNTGLAYTKICTIVAFDFTNDKRRWLTLLDYYHPANSYGFTHFNGALYTKLSFCKVVSYAFTFILLFESVKTRK